ncbi:hypothetical protein MRX96_041380 [Rhipicephalus microplus]
MIDLLKVLDQSGKTLSLKTVFGLGLSVIVYHHKYTHADVMTCSLILGFCKGNEEVSVVSFCVSCRHSQSIKHKKYKEGLGKSRDRTIVFPSRDTYTGAHSQIGVMNVLVLHWLCSPLPSMHNLKKPKYVSQHKSTQMQIITMLMSKGFPHGDIPCYITEFFLYVALTFQKHATPETAERILQTVIQATYCKPDSSVHFPQPKICGTTFSYQRDQCSKKILLAEDSAWNTGDENVVNLLPPQCCTRLPNASPKKQILGT